MNKNKEVEKGSSSEACAGTYNDGRRCLYVFIINGKMFEITNIGMCKWNKVIFSFLSTKEKYRDFYVLQRSPLDLDGKREEFINGIFCREYYGKQNCFVEMFEILWGMYLRKNKLPNRELAMGVCTELGLELKIACLYTDSFFRIFEIE